MLSNEITENVPVESLTVTDSDHVSGFQATDAKLTDSSLGGEREEEMGSKFTRDSVGSKPSKFNGREDTSSKRRNLTSQSNESHAKIADKQPRKKDIVDPAVTKQAKRGSMQRHQIALGSEQASQNLLSPTADLDRSETSLLDAATPGSFTGVPRSPRGSNGRKEGPGGQNGDIDSFSSAPTSPRNGNDRKGVQNVDPSNCPGAIAVDVRAYGARPGWTQRQAQQPGGARIQQNNDAFSLPPEMRMQQNIPPELREVAPNAIVQITPAQCQEGLTPDTGDLESSGTEKPPMTNSVTDKTRKKLYLLTTIGCIVLGVVIVVLTIFLAGRDEVDPATVQDATTIDETKRIIPTGCKDYSSVNIDPDKMNEEAFSRYSYLLQTVVPEYLPGFTPPSTKHEFCSPLHLGISWLAERSTPKLKDSSLLNQLWLSAVYFSLDGFAWGVERGWLEEENECYWSGVSCDESGTITHLAINNIPEAWNLGDALLRFRELYSMQGGKAFPMEVLFLTTLRSLDLPGHDIRGDIPTELNRLTDLERLNLSYNNFEGSFPLQKLTSLTRLREVRLEANGPLEVGLTEEIGLFRNLAFGTSKLGEGGEISSEIGRLSNLVQLSFAEKTKGTIPNELWNLTNLETLTFYKTDISGSLPSEIGNLSNLRSLVFSGAKITGTLPTEIGFLKRLRLLDFSFVELQGPIPTELASCTSMFNLDLQYTLLSGVIPSQMEALADLLYINLSNTFIGGNLPLSWVSGNTSRVLDVHNSEVEGTIQIEKESSKELGCLDLGNTDVDGTIGFDNCTVPFDAGSDLNKCNVLRRDDCTCCSIHEVNCKWYDLEEVMLIGCPNPQQHIPFEKSTMAAIVLPNFGV